MIGASGLRQSKYGFTFTVYDEGFQNNYTWPHSYSPNTTLPKGIKRYKGGFGYAWIEADDVNLFKHPPLSFCSLPKKEPWAPTAPITITKQMVEGLRTISANGSLQWSGTIMELAKDLYVALGLPRTKPLMRGLIGKQITKWQWEIFLEVAFRSNFSTHLDRVILELKRRVFLVLEKPDVCRTEIGFYTTPEWRHLRAEVLEVYGCNCMMCGRSPKHHGVVVHVDHIIPASKSPQLALTFSNMQVLCEDCNIGKSNFYSTDWRPYNAIQEPEG